MKAYSPEDTHRVYEVPQEVEKRLPPTDPWQVLRQVETGQGVKVTSWVAGTYTACAILANLAVIQMSLLAISLGVCFISSFIIAYLLATSHVIINDERLHAIMISHGADRMAVQDLDYISFFDITAYVTRVAFMHNLLSVWIIYSLLSFFMYLMSLKVIWAGWLVYGSTLAILCFFTYLFFKHDVNTVMTGIETTQIEMYLQKNRHLLKENMKRRK